MCTNAALCKTAQGWCQLRSLGVLGANEEEDHPQIKERRKSHKTKEQIRRAKWAKTRKIWWDDIHSWQRKNLRGREGEICLR